MSSDKAPEKPAFKLPVTNGPFKFGLPTSGTVIKFGQPLKTAQSEESKGLETKIEQLTSKPKNARVESIQPRTQAKVVESP